jgi:toxin ParE1/3/4
MPCDVITHPDAAEELEAALTWLGKRSDWTPDRLLAEYDANIQKIKKAPDTFRFIYREFRRVNLDRYPYAIIYRFRSNSIYVIAIMHERRHPDYWKHRIEDDI